MPTLRDTLLPVVDQLRGLPPAFGLRRFAVTVRRRVWSGAYVGAGTPTNQDIVLSPLPRVSQSFASASSNLAAMEYAQVRGNIVDDRIYSIERITPAYNGGGYSAEQLRIWIAPDVKNVEGIVVLVGDDALKRECIQLSVAQDKSFRYSMLVQETDRPRVALSSIAIMPSLLLVANGTKQQLTATGTFADGSTSDLSALAVWTSADITKATVDTLGNMSAIAAGTSLITASLTGISGSITATVT